MNKEFLIFLLFVSVGFLFFPLNGSAFEIGIEQIQNELVLPKTEAQSIVGSLLKVLTLEWVNLMSSGYSAPEDQAVIITLRRAVRTRVLNYAFIELPLEISKNLAKAIYKIGLFIYSPNDKTVVLLKEFEKFTVQKANEYALKWLLQKQIKVSTGNLKANYVSYNGKTTNVVFPYIIAYEPSGLKHGKMGIAIYSSGKIEPPAPQGDPNSLVFNDFWAQYEWQRAGNKTLPPFIVQIKGEVEKTRFDTYKWIKGPEISIEFPDYVPELVFEELSWLDKIKREIKNRMEPLQKIANWFKDLSKGVFSPILKKLGIFGAGMGMGTREEAVEVGPPLSPRLLEQAGLQSALEVRPQEGENEVGPSPSPLAAEGARGLTSISPTNADIQEQIDDIAEEIDIISQRIVELGQEQIADEVRPLPARRIHEVEPQEQEPEIEEKKEKEKEEKIEEEELVEETEETLPKILISEVCVGLDKSKNEFIELYNPNDFPASLNNSNFQLKLVSSSNKSTKKQIDWTNSVIPAKAYFLFVGGELIINSQKLKADADFTSQLTSTSGVIIADGKDNIIDRVGWGKANKPAPDSAVENQGIILEKGLETGQSLERKSASPLSDFDNNSLDFILNNQPSPTNSYGQKMVYTKPVDYAFSSVNTGYGGSSNSEPGPEPASQEPEYCSQIDLAEPTYSPVIINEIAWMGTSDSHNNEWIELKNISEQPVSLENWQLLDKNLDIVVIFNAEDSLEPNEFYILERIDDTTVSHILADKIYTGVLNNTNESLRLFNESCDLIDQALADPDWGAGDNSEKRTMERLFDLEWHAYVGDGENGIFGTPKSENSNPVEPEPEPESEPEPEPEPDPETPEYSLRNVVINEIAWMGTEALSSHEWIEFYNTTDSDINISTWSIYGADTGQCLNFADADDITATIIPATGYLIYANHENDVRDSEGINIVDIWDATIGMNNDSPGQIILYDAQDCERNTIDTVNQVEGHWFAGIASPDYISMERIDSSGAGTDSENWADNNSQNAQNGLDADGNTINGTPKSQNSSPLEPEPEPEPFEPVSFFWAQMQKNSQRSGQVLIAGPENADNYTTVFNGYVSDVITDQESTIYFGAANGIYCFNADFQEQWTLEEKSAIALVGADNGKIFAIVGRYGCEGMNPDTRCGAKLIGLNQAGAKFWEYNLSTLYADLKPVIFQDWVYVLGRCIGHTEFALFKFDFNGNLVWAFDPADGENGKLYENPEFSCAKGGSSSGTYISSPAVSFDGTIYFGDSENLYAVLSDGVLKWKREFDFINRVSTPSIGPDKTIYVIAGSPGIDEKAMLLALNPETGTTVWEFTLIGKRGAFGPSFGADGTLYVWGWRNGARFYALNPGIVEPENRILWQIDPHDIGTPVSLSAILVSQNAIYFTSNHNPQATMRAVNFDQEFADFSEKQIWRFNAYAGSSIHHLAISPNNTIFIPGQKLYAISL